MEAIFTQDTKGLFSEPLTPKTHYHPSTPRAQTKKEKQIIMAITGRVKEELDKALPHTLAPIQPSKVSTSPPASPTHWDLRVGPRNARPEGDDVCSPGSTKFDESWPSTSDCYKGQVPDGQEVEVGVVRHTGSRQMAGHHPSPSKESTLGRYIERFRHAPPTSRASRDTPSNSFWWKSSGGPQDASTPKSLTSQSREGSGLSHAPSNSSHTHTDPSPRVSVDPSLESRSQELIEKSQTVLSCTDSPPAQKYLNSVAMKEASSRQSTTARASRAAASTRGSGGGRVHVDMSEDILAQWRLCRRLEQARGEATAGLFYAPPQARGEVATRQFYAPPQARGEVAAGQFYAPPLQQCHALQQCYPSTSGHIRSTAPPPHSCQATPLCNTAPPPHSCQAMPPQYTCCSCVGRKGEGGAMPIERRSKSSKEVQTTPPGAAGEDHTHHYTLRKSKQGRTGAEVRDDGRSSFDNQPATPTHKGREAMPTSGKARRRSLTGIEEGAMPTYAMPTHAPPTHAGLALRESYREDSQFTMTFNSESDPDTSTCSSQHGPPTTSTPPTTGHHCHGNQASSSTPTDTEPGSPSSLQDAPTSKDDVSPPQRVPASGEASQWEDDMGDELLKLLITKAKLFEAQIRQVDGWLMGLHSPGQ